MADLVTISLLLALIVMYGTTTGLTSGIPLLYVDASVDNGDEEDTLDTPKPKHDTDRDGKSDDQDTDDDNDGVPDQQDDDDDNDNVPDNSDTDDDNDNVDDDSDTDDDNDNLPDDQDTDDDNDGVLDQDEVISSSSNDKPTISECMDSAGRPITTKVAQLFVAACLTWYPGVFKTEGGIMVVTNPDWVPGVDPFE